MLLAHPRISLLLDQRMRPDKRIVPRWHGAVFAAIRRVRGVIKTGEKRAGLVIYHYDSQAGELLDAAMRKRRRKSEASMPQLGKGQ
ncbi:hypothetical protein HYH02_014257 [Chlamydomonas schloesseri]|uniref:Uncharacterized protein n=1 Tax=Chlamydomonas schloesseri TaxID=2026947 RepID=A0A835VUY0_9CHLO|nr:hypothetical protein HYH02_014257 [Chlamydomonas schloesseri]|eukprot:KAG2428845.1 hypothetical protein HYH02_014257 [Chlamydomonas schloesseri]